MTSGINLIEQDIIELVQEAYDELYGTEINTEDEFHHLKYKAIVSSRTEPAPYFTHVEKAILQYYKIESISELQIYSENRSSFEGFVRALYNDIVTHGAYSHMNYNDFKAYNPNSV